MSWSWGSLGVPGEMGELCWSLRFLAAGMGLS